MFSETSPNELKPVALGLKRFGKTNQNTTRTGPMQNQCSRNLPRGWQVVILMTFLPFAFYLSVCFSL